MVVHLTDHVLDLSIISAHLLLKQNILELFRLDDAGTIGVDCHELGLQISNFILRCRFDDQVHGCLLQITSSLEVLQAFNDLITDEYV